MWYQFKSWNQPTLYGWTQDPKIADLACDRLNKGREINLYHAHELSDAEAEALNLETRDDHIITDDTTMSAAPRARLAASLHRLHWGPVDLAHHSGAHKATTLRWVSGETTPPPELLDWLDRLVTWLNTNPAPRRVYAYKGSE